MQLPQWLYPVQRLAAPKYFYLFAKRIQPFVGLLTLLAFAYGLIGGLYCAPADAQQSDAFRIIYIHVPAAFLSLLVYSVMSGCAIVYLIWHVKLADLIHSLSTPLGAWFTFIALFTGSLWGKPMWGTYWIWDARLTSELILLFIYFGILGLGQAIRDRNQRAKAVAILTLIGLVDLPIIHYSVNWWNTLHQGATLRLLDKPLIAPEMLYPLLAMIVAFKGFYVYLLLQKARTELLSREKNARWIDELSL
jgi:heme exporter protein C